MHIPEFLDSLIRQDRRLSAGVASALATMEPIIQASRLPFFPEYTDHGPQHNEEVLQTAVEIVHDDGRPLLTPQDAAILVLAVLLHDCGMHLTEDGFISLIQPGCRWTGVSEFADRPWAELWEEFIADARKFDDRKLTALFGDPEPIRRPPMNPAHLTERDKLLIGEFIRRQHPRLAHDIALRGIPAADSGAYAVLTGLSNDLIDLAGVVARSHGVSLRKCLDYLGRRYNVRDLLDPDGRLPLNLQRTALVGGRLPFDDVLLDSVFRDFTTYAVVKAPKGMTTDMEDYFDFYPGLKMSEWWRNQCSPWVCTRHAISVADVGLLNKLGIKSVLLAPQWMLNNLAEHQGRSFLMSYMGGIIPFAESTSRSEPTLATDLLFAQGTSVWAGLARNTDGRRVLFRRNMYNYILRLKRISAHEKKILVKRAELLDEGQWVLVSNGKCPEESNFPFVEFVERFAVRDELGIAGLADVAAELYRSEESLRVGDSKLAGVWTSVIGAAAIPFAGSKRRALRERLVTARTNR